MLDGIYRLTFARLPIESASGSSPFFAAVQLSLRGPPGEGLRSREHHNIGGGRGSAGAPESTTTGIGGFQHPRCRATERKDDVRSFISLPCLDACLPLLILAEDSLPSLSLRLAYQPFSLLDLISSAQKSDETCPDITISDGTFKSRMSLDSFFSFAHGRCINPFQKFQEKKFKLSENFGFVTMFFKFYVRN